MALVAYRLLAQTPTDVAGVVFGTMDGSSWPLDLTMPVKFWDARVRAADPPGNWWEEGYDDSAWSTAPGGYFVSDPGDTLYRPARHDKYLTPGPSWNPPPNFTPEDPAVYGTYTYTGSLSASDCTDFGVDRGSGGVTMYLYVRAAFSIQETANYRMRVFFDNSVKLYLNGVLTLEQAALGTRAFIYQIQRDTSTLCRSAINADEPWMYWPLSDDFAGTTVYDATGNGRTGTRYGGVLLDPTACGGQGMAQFDGQNDGIEMSEAFVSNAAFQALLGLSGNWAREAWVEPSRSTVLNQSYGSNNGDWPGTMAFADYVFDAPQGVGTYAPSGPYGTGLIVGTNGFQIITHRGERLVGPGVAMDLTGRRHYVLQGYTANGKTRLTLHINGLKVFDGTVQQDQPCYYGTAIGDGPYGFFQGTIQHYALYMKNLTDSDIQEHILACQCGGKSGWTVGYIGTGSGSATPAKNPLEPFPADSVVRYWDVQARGTQPPSASNWLAADYDDSAWSLGWAYLVNNEVFPNDDGAYIVGGTAAPTAAVDRLNRNPDSPNYSGYMRQFTRIARGSGGTVVYARAKFTVAVAGTYLMRYRGDNITNFYIDGVYRTGTSFANDGQATIFLSAGEHTVAYYLDGDGSTDVAVCAIFDPSLA